MVPFGGKTQLKPHPDWSLLGVQLKFCDEHPRPYCRGVPSLGLAAILSLRDGIFFSITSFSQLKNFKKKFKRRLNGPHKNKTAANQELNLPSTATCTIRDGPVNLVGRGGGGSGRMTSEQYFLLL